MTQRLQYFSIVCAGILFVTCACAFIMSLIESRGGRYPTWKVVCCELPILVYTLLFLGFILPPKLPTPQVLLLAGFTAALLVAFLLRVFRYGIRREAHERAQLLASNDEVKKEIEEARVQVMSAMEREALLKAAKPKRKSRYERDLVI
jgi:hypothetical protein